ncbi:uncharacterized protein LOC133832558 [Humulus lupulus]|uniref:uncharacterized protein LOC133832558 n=1 Tax=Humulus lupulus TaxID=3486 RepID=UPI002B40C664|nr:uncharacterized protein LOC133832558 [Humulus lupulus]
MIIPAKIFKEISTMCRAFLWSGQASLAGTGRLSWDYVCQSKKAGGLGFKNSTDWNIAAMGKYVWAVVEKKDNLWVKWVHHVYIKQEDWWNYSAPVYSSWYWRKIDEVKRKFKSLIARLQVHKEEYRISIGYSYIHPSLDKVHWSKEVWGRLNTPKHSFIFWLAVHNRLNTKDRLKRHGVLDQSECLFYGVVEESCEHLFFNCQFSLSCYHQILQWLNWRTHLSSLSKIIRWIERASNTKFHKQVFSAAIAALLYQIWKARNDALWLGKIMQPYLIVQNTKVSVKNRISYILPKKISQRDRDWFGVL